MPACAAPGLDAETCDVAGVIGNGVQMVGQLVIFYGFQVIDTLGFTN